MPYTNLYPMILPKIIETKTQKEVPQQKPASGNKLYIMHKNHVQNLTFHISYSKGFLLI